MSRRQRDRSGPTPAKPVRPYDESAVRAAYEPPSTGRTRWQGAELDWVEALSRCAHWRRQALDLEARAVPAARAAGKSWDAISVALGGKPSGEHLRRTYGTITS